MCRRFNSHLSKKDYCRSVWPSDTKYKHRDKHQTNPPIAWCHYSRISWSADRTSSVCIPWKPSAEACWHKNCRGMLWLKLNCSIQFSSILYSSFWSSYWHRKRHYMFKHTILITHNLTYIPLPNKVYVVLNMTSVLF
jgi:hypothetical protein